MWRVALIYDATMAYDLQVIGGVAAYLQEGAKWNVHIEDNTLRPHQLPDLGAWEGDGIIANLDHPNVAVAIAESKLPTVGFGSGYGWYAPESHIPYFFTNNLAIARLAADHLLERGFRHFAYCGYTRTAINGWSEEREREFTERIKLRGFSCTIYGSRQRSNQSWAHIQKALCAWLVSLPKPVGLMAANDKRARQVLDACRVCGLQVPEQIAVIGVDNDEVLCRLSTPLLTSIEQGAARIGYEAAALLDRIMSGTGSAERRYVIDPEGVVTRLSTDVLPTEDPQVAKAMLFIREHACDGIKVPDVVAAAAGSRSGLEARFKNVLGRTLHTAIREVQLDRVKSLVTGTNQAPKEIAASTGFKSVQHMSTLFKRAVGLPPAEYRRLVVSAAPPQAPRAIAAKKSLESHDTSTENYRFPVKL